MCQIVNGLDKTGGTKKAVRETYPRAISCLLLLFLLRTVGIDLCYMHNVADIYFFLLFVALPFTSFKDELESSDPFIVGLGGLFCRLLPFARLTVKFVCFVETLTEILSLL